MNMSAVIKFNVTALVDLLRDKTEQRYNDFHTEAYFLLFNTQDTYLIKPQECIFCVNICICINKGCMQKLLIKIQYLAGAG